MGRALGGVAVGRRDNPHVVVCVPPVGYSDMKADGEEQDSEVDIIR